MATDRVNMSVGNGAANGAQVRGGTETGQRVSGATLNGDAHLSQSHDKSGNGQEPASVSAKSQANGIDTSRLRESENVRNATSPGQVPLEMAQMLSSAGLDDAYIPMAQLIQRSAEICWNDLLDLIERLADKPVAPTRTDQPTLPGGVPNDTSSQNVEKKEMVWKFAQEHKDVFIKLMVLLEWSKNGEDVRRTIALNSWLHEQRSAFQGARAILAGIMRDLAGAQIPNPDLETAAEVLATGKVAAFSDLGYVEPEPLTPKQMLKTLQQLDFVLTTRLTLTDSIPSQLRDWHVHDGRVTFRVPHEFELDLSVVSESDDAQFGMVDLRFTFSPSPSMSDDMFNELTYLTNFHLQKDGLAGAFDALHDLTLSYKIVELHKQALSLARMQWTGHLRIEMVRRCIVIQYWLQKPSSKSWIEIGIDSGRGKEAGSGGTPATPRLCIQWTRDGQQVSDHDIRVDESHLSVERMLREVIAQHSVHIFDAIYDRMSTLPLYQEDELEIEQSSCLTDPTECKLRFELWKDEFVETALEPISGSFVIEPATEWSTRLQYELTRSKNRVEDFVGRTTRMRCAVAETRIVRSTHDTVWKHLPGLRGMLPDVKALFGKSCQRAAFFGHAKLQSSWMLAASQSSEGDRWWVIYLDSRQGPGQVDLGHVWRQPLDTKRVHQERALDWTYFERLSEYVSSIVPLQKVCQEFDGRKIKYSLPVCPPFMSQRSMPALAFDLEDTGTSSNYIRPGIELVCGRSDTGSDNTPILVRAQLNCDQQLLAALQSQFTQPWVVTPATRSLHYTTTTRDGQPVLDTILNKIRRMEDLVSCISLISRSQVWKMRPTSVDGLHIVYGTQGNEELSLLIQLGEASNGLSVDLIPPDSNPHRLVASQVSEILSDQEGDLETRLRKVLSLLHLSLPLLQCLHDLQTKQKITTTAPRPIDLEEMRQLVDVSVLVRERMSFALCFRTAGGAPPQEPATREAARKPLIRLDIKAQPFRDARKIGWIVRPSPEEHHAANREMFSSLVKRLTDDVFRKGKDDGWLGLDTAGWCQTNSPDRLIFAVYENIVAWAKDNVSNNTRPNTSPKTKPNTGSNPKPAPASKALNTKRQPSQNQPAPRQQGGSAVKNPAGAPVNGGKTAGAHNGPAGNISSRVMTAAPQPVRNTNPNQQRAQQGGQFGRNQKQNNIKQEVITIE